MARRYTKSLVIPTLKITGGMFSDAGNITTDGLRTLRPQNCWIRVAPSRYSKVRKVIFHVALQWLENNPARNVDVRLMVGPMSTSAVSRAIHSKAFALSSIVRNTVGQSTPWDFEPSNPVNVNFQNTMLYSKRGIRDTLNGHYNGIVTEGDVHVFRIEFDRFTGDADDFFADWDAVTDVGNDEGYVAYNIYVGFVQSTFVAGSTSLVQCLSAGCHVVQAPGPVNDTCTYVDTSRLGFYTTHLQGIARRTAFSVHPDEHVSRWAFDSNEWNGITQVAQWNQGCAGIIAAGQFGRFRVDRVPGPTGVITTLDQQDFNSLSGSNALDVVRSADILPQILDGDRISGDYLYEGISGQHT